MSAMKERFLSGRQIVCCGGEVEIPWSFTETRLGWRIAYAVCPGCLTFYVHQEHRDKWECQQEGVRAPTWVSPSGQRVSAG